MLDSDVLIPIATLILGSVLTLIAEERRDIRAARREERSRQAEREAKRAEREAEFQRATLLRLQEQLHGLLRAEASVQHEMQTEQRTKGTPWRQIRLRSELDEEVRSLRAEIAVLYVRVKDDEVRHMADQLTADTSMVALAADSAEALVALNTGFTMFLTLNERIGHLLRNVY